MTTFADNIYTGMPAIISANATRAPAMLTKRIRFTAPIGAQTKQVTLPRGAQCLDANVFMVVNGTTATSDTCTISAGGTTLITISQFGSAGGVLRSTTSLQGIITNNASATMSMSTVNDTVVSLTTINTDATLDYVVELLFNRMDGIGAR